MPEKLHQLERLRLERGWSYRDLAENIHLVTKIRKSQDTWRKICQGKTEQAHGPTLYALNQFYAALAINGHRRRKAS